VTYYETISYLEKSSNMTDMIDSENGKRKRSLAEILLVCVALGSLILATIIGNIFVISAIILEKNLKTVGNYLVLSLAV
jgi:5-hydroxytryptamine receptor 1